MPTTLFLASTGDFHIGRYQLTKHFPVLKDWQPAHNDKGQCARQLAGVDDGPFEGWRVPLFVCRLCGNLACGAFTVLVSEESGSVKWSEFGWIADDNRSIIQDENMKRFGPFFFNRKEYMARFSSYI
ncbi:MAG: hypothetical protein P1V97_22855 [Planctomycetota bacterium]|nr:hypothetical protein [Planctomycetota bacterium]